MWFKTYHENNENKHSILILHESERKHEKDDFKIYRHYIKSLMSGHNDYKGTLLVKWGNYQSIVQKLRKLLWLLLNLLKELNKYNIQNIELEIEFLPKDYCEDDIINKIISTINSIYIDIDMYIEEFYCDMCFEDLCLQFALNF